MNPSDTIKDVVTTSPGADVIALVLLGSAMGAWQLSNLAATVVPGIAVFLAYVWGKTNGRVYADE